MNKVTLLKIVVLTVSIVELASSWKYALDGNYGNAMIFAGGGLATVGWFTTISPKTFKDFQTPVSVLVAKEKSRGERGQLFSLMPLAWILLFSGIVTTLLFS